MTQVWESLVIANAFTKMPIWVISESLELVLYLVGEVTGFDYGVDNLFGGEFRVKVGNIQDGFNRWFEGGLDLLGKKTTKDE